MTDLIMTEIIERLAAAEEQMARETNAALYPNGRQAYVDEFDRRFTGVSSLNVPREPLPFWQNR